MVLDDNNDFGGMDKGTTHQETPDYWIEKTLVVPAAELKRAKSARVRVYLHAFDYSYAKGETPNGLDESLEMLVNGKSHVYRTDSGLPARPSPATPARHDWYDFIIPVAELKAGANTISFRKAPSPNDKNDDFVYIGVDNNISQGRSRASLDGGKTWSSEKLNVPGGGGEYMIRLVLLDADLKASARWTPQQKTGKTADPNALIGYAESGAGATTLELDTSLIDAASPVMARVQYTGATAPKLQWTDEQGTVLSGKTSAENGVLNATLPPSVQRPAKLEITAPAGVVSAVSFDYTRAVSANPSATVNMAPDVAAPRGKAVARAPRATIAPAGFTLENATLRAQFSTKPALKMESLQSELLGRNVMAHPDETHLFLTEIGDARFGAEDWTVQSVKPLTAPRQGVEVALRLPAHNLTARFSVWVDEKTLRFGLDTTNAGTAEQSWKVAFPHLGGVSLSETGDDYYLFPYRGGIITDTPANLRTVYGEQTAWWQMVDLFSPSGGAGLSLRADDSTGLYKGIALRKGTLLATGASKTDAGRTMLPEMFWQNSLAAAPGIGVTFEYLRYTRAAGQSFSPPDAVLEAHAGDWRTAMQGYADWAHQVWKWRKPNPKMADVWNITSPGWGKSVLFKDGKYRTDYITPLYDAAELQSWWTASDVGPWGVPVDRAKEELGAKFWNQYLNGYIVPNPATGKLQYRFNIGDYTGYNPEWGGLPALRAHIDKMQEAGQVAMLYTTPALADWNTDFGRKFGAKYGAINPRWKDGLSDDIPTPPAPKDYIGTYAAWTIDPDNAETPDYVAAQMKRIIQETGADGLRLDVYGYQGYANENPNFERLFAEPGQNAYMQATVNATAKVRAALDEISPDVVLTAEFPGYDALARYLDGSIVYETGQSVMPGVRPVPINLFRFYFPEFKTYDLDNLSEGARSPQAREWRFWNAMGAFGIVHAAPYHNILEENGDAFGSQTPQPLVATLVPRVYANRFTDGDKSLTLLYNARQFTVNEPLLKVAPKANEHLFDLLSGREIVAPNGELTLKLAPTQAAAIAQLPRRLTVEQSETQVTARVSGAAGGLRVALCNAQGAIKAEAPVQGGAATLPLSAGAAYVKLLGEKYLVDAAALPRPVAVAVAAPSPTVGAPAPVAQNANRKIIFGDKADFNSVENGAAGGAANGGLIVGGSPVKPAGGRAPIFVFDLSAYKGKKFAAADLSLFLVAREAGANFNVDLYGVGYGKSAKAPTPARYYAGAFGQDETTGVMPIQPAYATTASPAGRFATTSEAGNAKLLEFLNARGDNDFVFVRLNPDKPVSGATLNTYTFIAADTQSGKSGTDTDPKLAVTLKP